MEFNLADLFEHAVEQYPDREAVVANGERRTYSELEERANRLAHHLSAAGVAPGDHVAVYAYNIIEWAEAMLAIYKIRGVCINVNFRYVADELAYLLDQAKPVAMVFQRQFTDRVAEVAPKVPALRHLLVVEDGTDPAEADAAALGALPYEDALASGSPERDFPPRSADDVYLLFTGGTTGMPKGVMWRQEDVIFALGGGIDPTNGQRVDRPEDLAEKGRGGAGSFFPIAPLMHGATQWGLLQNLSKGQRVLLIDKFDAHGVWSIVEREKANVIMITGDAMARPLIEAVDEPRPDGREGGYDLSSLFAVASSAALFSPSLKEAFMTRLNVVVSDAVGASESGANGVGVAVKGQDAPDGGGITIKAVPDSVVLDDDLNPLPIGVIGKLGRKGNIPIGYLGDPVKTAEVFRTAPDGTRYVVPGDYARLEGDGLITLLGRGSATINSGGEKIFTEEVEGAVKSHPDVYDAIVVGVPHDRWGQTVAVVVQPRDGTEPTLEAIQEHCRTKIAGYKVPRVMRIVGETRRTPTGKPDLPWALSVCTAE
ncbi:acyl-CoA synthetase [Yinghuangia seranimata]|uniref:acyl-CoA synthetase n=1 Tax=Yinghuangia seranimata TaxID=408067 RepID=UPI00248C1BA9|nr:acyl-CoA synthetase [Yinghuangia seranimata]MDI2132899.1 acyl-CoA synthetase [Yinghuangia seranimata]